MGINKDIFNDKYLALKAEYDRLQKSIKVVEEKLSAYEVVIADCSDDADSKETLEGAIIRIARNNGGIFNIYEHKAQLIEEGHLRGNGESISQTLYHLFSNSKRFEKTGHRGRWKLVL